MPKDYSVSTLHPPNSKARWTPPFRRIPKWEKKFWPVFMVCGFFATPGWILYHLPDYRGGVRPHLSYIRKQEREEAAKAAATGN